MFSTIFLDFDLETIKQKINIHFVMQSFFGDCTRGGRSENSEVKYHDTRALYRKTIINENLSVIMSMVY